ncbi:hypothetical protein AB0K09_19085 [Streptomyces sp. NPDC049577]|uniref:hypothetical protein n=1 Tax=Streptomyces sp. NPDC049577 TaxID=3155153 RepID=UPI0034362A6F
MSPHRGQERQAFQAALDSPCVVDTGTLRWISLALRRGPSEPASPTPLVISPPPVPRAPAPVMAWSGRWHARPRRRHRGEPAPRSLLAVLVLVFAPAAGAVGVLVALLR